MRQLLDAPEGDPRATAWAAFLQEVSPLVLHVARRLGGDHDVVMDRYAFVVEALRHDEHRRLRGWLTDGRGEFTTWLIVVTRRLCFDHYRHRYGRPQGLSREAAEDRATRRRLVDLVGEELAADGTPTTSLEAPDEDLRRVERNERLAAALASLDPADRLLLRLRFEDGRSVPQIAGLVGAPSPFVVYRRVAKILDTLRTRLLQSGVDGSEP
ncbi:MAG: sigma-70 family RNA polymerase sigma factor [Gemmatimonadales bacterium]|nr:sigma-70 family RNA polymerase sigma factor [Gemmatimonadales bacterium]